MQPKKLICIFSFLFSQHVSALADHHQVLHFMLKLSNCIAYHFYLVLLSRDEAGRVQHNHNRTTAGLYNINTEGTSGRRLVRGKDFKNKNKNTF
jgi:hypothetical protein